MVEEGCDGIKCRSQAVMQKLARWHSPADCILKILHHDSAISALMEPAVDLDFGDTVEDAPLHTFFSVVHG